MSTSQLPCYIEFLKAAEALKDTLRSGRTSSGRQESTAEHSWRLALFATVLQDELAGLDFTRVLMLCLVHDLGEALGGDVPATALADPAEKSARERRDLATLLEPLPEPVRGRLMAVWEEYELGVTPEAKLVKGLDKLETIVQHNQGRNAGGFDYDFNLSYGARQTAQHPLLAAMRELVDKETRLRAREVLADKPLPALPAMAPGTLPEPHRRFLDACIPLLQDDARIAQVWVGGSYVTDRMDEFSDVDLVIVVAASEFQQVKAERHAVAARLGALLSAFSAEHIGEPDLLICLYDHPLLHVDLKFVAHDPQASLPASYRLLWSRPAAPGVPGVPGAPGAPSLAAVPAVDIDWIEARFWTWVHYGAGKIGRGELFEALDFLSFLRMSVLGPLALERHGAPPFGVRRVETTLPPDLLAMLARTIASYDARDCVRALEQCVAMYRSVRSDRAGPAFGNANAERAAMAYLGRVVASLEPK